MPHKFPPNPSLAEVPPKTLSITAFINFPFHSNGAPCPPKFMCIKEFYSELPPTTEDAIKMVQKESQLTTLSFGSIMTQIIAFTRIS